MTKMQSTKTNNITWAVCKNEGTATIFCMDCQEQLNTVKVSEARLYVDDFKTSHQCLK